jgi:MerR family transcriptional regulator, light-induced transcriptional regulator
VIGGQGYLRIGVLAQRTGVSPELLRAWEQRYGLLHPSRSEGGFRLYSDDDERRVRLTTDLIANGLSAAEAARQALEADVSTPPPVDGVLVGELAGRLRESLDAMDAEVAHLVFDRLLATLSVTTVLGEVVLPYLRELGDRWATGDVSVAQEHFASNLIRGRLLGLARGWGAGEGPNVLLACPPGEAHDLALIVFGIEVARRGWRVTFLGADTPMATIEETVRRLRPALVVLAVSDPARIREQGKAIRSIAAVSPVAVGGNIGPDQAEAMGVSLWSGGPIEAARSMTERS